MNEWKELIARLRLDYTADMLALSLMQQTAERIEMKTEREALIEKLRLDYTASPMALGFMKQAADMLEADSEPKCSDHPDAPHGFNRNASHSIDRYVCECEGWVPDTLAVRKAALEEAVKVCEAVEHDHLDTYKHKPGVND